MNQPVYVGVTDIARRLNIPANTVSQWIWRGRFPKPDLKIGRCSAWDWETVDNWWANNGDNCVHCGQPINRIRPK